MASPSRAVRSQWLRQNTLILSSPRSRARRWQSSLAGVQDEMMKRKISPIFDDLTPQTSYRLDMTLADFLPDARPPAVLPSPKNPQVLLPPHHLIYFEPTKRASAMLADGTNPDQSPGEPFVRRMWAGGRVHYNNSQPLLLDSSRGVCAEFIRSVVAKGKEGDEKLFVGIERRIAKATDEELEMSDAAAQDAELDMADANADRDVEPENSVKDHLEHKVRQRLWRDREEDFGPCAIVETRNIVFMRARSAEQARADSARAAQKQLKPQLTPDFSHSIVPDPKLLFRFSALTFNAHAIHLDPQYSREVEGHRNLLFHGPMSFTFMMILLQRELGKQGNEVVKSVEYRNLAPLYCNEPVKFCGTKVDDNKWEIWTETPQGGLSVKGTAVTEQGPIDKSNLQY